MFLNNFCEFKYPTRLSIKNKLQLVDEPKDFQVDNKTKQEAIKPFYIFYNNL